MKTTNSLPWQQQAAALRERLAALPNVPAGVLAAFDELCLTFGLEANGMRHLHRAWRHAKLRQETYPEGYDNTAFAHVQLWMLRLAMSQAAGEVEAALQAEPSLPGSLPVRAAEVVDA